MAHLLILLHLSLYQISNNFCSNRNNRTKQELIGQRGKIKKSVGLGGWHWLKLHSGEEVRLQRNALTVLEPPSNQESDFSEEEENAANQTGIL